MMGSVRLWKCQIVEVRDCAIPQFRNSAFLFVALLALTSLWWTPAALAHGGGTPQLVDTPAGPYHLYTWTNPDPVRAGTMHVTVALVDPGNEQPVLGAEVLVTAAPADGSVPVSGRATHDQATIKAYYETDLVIPTPGEWQISISYETPRGAGSASFAVAVERKSFVNWLWIGIGALVLAIVAWLVWPKSRQAGPQTRPTPAAKAER